MKFLFFMTQRGLTWNVVFLHLILKKDLLNVVWISSVIIIIIIIIESIIFMYSMNQKYFKVGGRQATVVQRYLPESHVFVCQDLNDYKGF